mgnify:CR=1 FL=1
MRIRLRSAWPYHMLAWLTTIPLLFLLLAATDVSSQGPLSAQIQRAIRSLTAGSTSFTSLNISGQTLTAGTTLPATCTTGAAFLRSTAPAGLFVCTATNTWGGSTGIGPSSVSSWPAQTTTVRTVKGTAGTVTGYYVYNPNATVAYVQFFNVASATTVTLGTTVPDLTIGIPATAGANLLGDGITFSLGIKIACTTTALGLTAPSTGLDVNIYYQ